MQQLINKIEWIVDEVLRFVGVNPANADGEKNIQ